MAGKTISDTNIAQVLPKRGHSAGFVSFRLDRQGVPKTIVSLELPAFFWGESKNGIHGSNPRGGPDLADQEAAGRLKRDAIWRRDSPGEDGKPALFAGIDGPVPSLYHRRFHPAPPTTEPLLCSGG